MSKVIKLFINEMSKIFAKKSSYIMLAVIVVITFGFGILTVTIPNKLSNSFTENWRDSYERDIQFLKQELEHIDDTNGDRPKGDKESIQNSIDELQYKLDNDVSPDSWKNKLVEELYYVVYPEINAIGQLPGSEERLNQLEKKVKDIEKAIEENDWRQYIEEQKQAVLDDETIPKEQKDLMIYEYDMRLEYDIEPGSSNWMGSSNWKTNSLEQIVNAKQQLNIYENYDPDSSKGGQMDLTEDEIQKQIDSAKKTIALNEHRIKTNNAPYSLGSMMGFMETSSGLVDLVSMLVIIIVGSIAASEYTSGTIKLLLISPNKRWKIWLAKFLASCAVAVILLIILYITATVTGVIVSSGTDSQVRDYIYYLGNGEILEINFFTYIAIRYLNGAITLIVMASLAYMLSIMFRNSAVAIGVGIFLSLAGSVINAVLLFQLKYNWAKYLIFANMDLNRFFDASVIQGITSIPDMPSLSYQGSLIVLGAHLALFLIVSQLAFTRTDVK